MSYDTNLYQLVADEAAHDYDPEPEPPQLETESAGGGMKPPARRYIATGAYDDDGWWHELRIDDRFHPDDLGLF